MPWMSFEEWFHFFNDVFFFNDQTFSFSVAASDNGLTWFMPYGGWRNLNFDRSETNAELSLNGILRKILGLNKNFAHLKVNAIAVLLLLRSLYVGDDTEVKIPWSPLL